MKRIFLFSLLLLSIGLHSYVCWEENGKAIRQETNLNYSSAVINLSGGGYMLMWSDASVGLQEMKVQKVSADGENIWSEPVILTTRECFYPNGEVLGETSDGDILAAWYELGDPAILRVQKIDTAGNLLWGETGLIFELGQEADNCFPFRAVTDEVGGIYLVWFEGYQVKAIFLDEDGNTGNGWASSGNAIYSGNTHIYNLSVIKDGFGGFVIALRLSLNDVVLQRCDNQGNLHWGNGLTMDDLFADEDLGLIPWDEGQYAVIVEQNNQFMANIFDYSGEFIYSELQLIASVQEEYETGKAKGVQTSDGKLGIIYSVIDWDGNSTYLRAQKTDLETGLEWGDFGVLLGVSEDRYPYSTDIAADHAGGFALFWEAVAENSYDTCYQHLDSTGDALAGFDPVLAGSSYQPGLSVKVIRDAENSVLFWRQCLQDTNEIVIQIFDSEENAQITELGNTIWSVLAGTTRSPYNLKAQGNLSVIGWRDERYSQPQIYVQAINNDTGDLLYADDGISATMQSELEEGYGNIYISDNCERICATYGIESEMYFLGGVQILDQDGNRLLGDDGMIFNAEADLHDVAISNSGENEFLIVWSEDNGDFMNPVWNLKAQKIVNDQFIWGNGLTLLVDSEHDISDIKIQYPYISWIEWDFPASDLRLTKIGDDGNIAPGWDPEGLVVSENYLNKTSRIYNNDTGIYIFWIERNDENSRQMKGQRYSAEGELLWEEGGRLFGDYYEDINDYQLKDDYLYCFVYEPDSPYTLYKYNLDGESEWDEGLVFESTLELDYREFSVWEDAIIVYAVSVVNSTLASYDIYAMIYDTDGNVVENFPPGGLEVCTQQHSQSVTACASDENGSSIVLWKDGRGEYTPGADHSLYVQKIDLNVAPITDEEIIDGNLLNVSNYPNPFRQSTTLKCDLPRNIEDAEIVIYNIKGQKVRSLPATSNEVEWDCRNQAGKLAGSGVYFYVLQGKNIKSETGKMIMLR